MANKEQETYTLTVNGVEHEVIVIDDHDPSFVLVAIMDSYPHNVVIVNADDLSATPKETPPPIPTEVRIT